MNPREKLLDEIAAHLAEELGDLPTAAAIARLVGEEVLSWRTPEIDAREIKTSLTFTFGNRMQPNGNRTPGPVNEALADVAVRLHRATSAPVYAQWEVAEATGSRISPDRLFTIYPRRDERSEPRYLSTSGVVEEIVRRVGNPAALCTFGIVAFADHAWRCVATARSYGGTDLAPSSCRMAEYHLAWHAPRIR